MPRTENLKDGWMCFREPDGDGFLPNPEPTGPVQCVPIFMEPPLGWWAGSANQLKDVAATAEDVLKA